MFNCVLKSLSTTELIAISEELRNPDVQTESIVNQLISKSNSPVLIGNATMEKVRVKLDQEILLEFCDRIVKDGQLILEYLKNDCNG
jgi:hypothetical protein